MYYCEKCKIKIRTSHEKCPLCNGVISGTREEALFPELRDEKAIINYFIRIVTFVCVLAEIVLFTMTETITNGSEVIYYIMGSVVLFWIIIIASVVKRYNFIKNIWWQMIILISALTIIDVVGLNIGWSYNYAMQVIILVGIATDIIYIFIKKVPVQEYMIYMLMECVVGVVPFVLFKVGLIENKVLSLICLMVSLVLLAFLIIFCHNDVADELSKKFHM